MHCRQCILTNVKLCNYKLSSYKTNFVRFDIKLSDLFFNSCNQFLFSFLIKKQVFFRGSYCIFLTIIFHIITACFRAVVDIETKTFIHCGTGLGNADKFFRSPPHDFPRNQMCKPSIADGFSLLQLKEISQIHSASWNNKCKYNARDHWRFFKLFFHFPQIHLASI